MVVVLGLFFAGLLLSIQLANGSMDDVINEINMNKDGRKYPVVLINGWGGSALDGSSTEYTKTHVSKKCATDFVDKNLWVSPSTLLNIVL